MWVTVVGFFILAFGLLAAVAVCIFGVVKPQRTEGYALNNLPTAGSGSQFNGGPVVPSYYAPSRAANQRTLVAA